jgi:4-diphosphocytidyl-2-C-methyl-D-erythritol kinase
MPSPTILPCPAKINLFLEVRGKRADGYHELGTLFQALDFGDTLSAEPWDSIEILCDTEIPGRPQDNLVYKAAMLLRERYPDRVKPKHGIRFSLQKRVPTGAGLGGGSSDAAAALRLTNTLWNLGLSNLELRTLAPELGADVAFFLFQPTAFAEGRGEILSPAPEPYPFHIILVTPSCHVDTAWAYRQLQDLPFKTRTSRWNDFKSRYAKEGRDASFYTALHNDFEDPIVSHFPEIHQIREVLASFQPEKTLLTGSGASLFALFKEEAKAQECLSAVAPRGRFSIRTCFKTGAFF